MPVYVYQCDVCDRRYELHRHFGAPHPTVCPKGHPGLKRIFSPPSIIFKGSGFYVTDNGRNGLVSSADEKTKTPAQAENDETESKTKKVEAEAKTQKVKAEAKTQKEGAQTKANKEGKAE